MEIVQAETRRRRLVFSLLCLVTFALFVAAMLELILSGGMTLAKWLIGLAFVLTAPYTVIGFWNAAIGLWLLHRSPKTVHAMPGVAELRDSSPLPVLTCDTVLLVTLRNEMPAPVFERLTRMRASLTGTGQQSRFTFAVLSDSDDADVIDAETRTFTGFLRQRGYAEPQPIYRRRERNYGYKAGNIREFVEMRGDSYEYFIPLDADSLMSGDLMVRMVATMQARPKLGILQSLVVGMPSTNGFARVFQFGMRHGMRVFTTGAAWWTADCGSYWGHNAVIRTAPFREHCKLPELRGSPPWGGAILSHDQLEAAFMRRAGYEVRTIPLESESYEINPPTLPDFIRRELRWCQGNMQYFRLVMTPGLKPASRMQLLVAIGMYLAQGAWIGMIVIACIGAMTGGFRIGNLTLGVGLFAGVFFLSVAPKLFGAIDVSLSAGGPKRYGGAAAFGISVCLELLSSMLMAPIVALSVAMFLIGLIFHKSVTWGVQNRDRTEIAWHRAFLVLAPHSVAGIALAAALWWAGGVMATVWALPVIAGWVLAVPYTVLGAKPGVGTRLFRLGLFSIPEEQSTPSVLVHRSDDDPEQLLGEPAQSQSPTTSRRPVLTGFMKEKR